MERVTLWRRTFEKRLVRRRFVGSYPQHEKAPHTEGGCEGRFALEQVLSQLWGAKVDPELIVESVALCYELGGAEPHHCVQDDALSIESKFCHDDVGWPSVL